MRYRKRVGSLSRKKTGVETAEKEKEEEEEDVGEGRVVVVYKCSS
jgi:hypothetical protein